MSDAAERLMDALRDFAAGLDVEQRQLLAALLAPGIARALQPEPEVEGFGLAEWLPSSLPEALEREIRERDITVEGL